MLLLSIFGSPRRNGFSSRLHDELIIPFRDRGFFIEKFYAYENVVKPCTGCGWCANHVECVLKDSMSDLYRIIREADVISVSSPLYFSSFPSPLKGVIDRCQLLWEENRHRGDHTVKTKKGIFICSAGDSYKGMFDGVTMGIKHFYKAINCTFNPDDAILYPSSDTSEEISLEFLEKVRLTGERYSVF